METTITGYIEFSVVAHRPQSPGRARNEHMFDEHLQTMNLASQNTTLNHEALNLDVQYSASSSSAISFAFFNSLRRLKPWKPGKGLKASKV